MTDDPTETSAARNRATDRDEVRGEVRDEGAGAPPPSPADEAPRPAGATRDDRGTDAGGTDTGTRSGSTRASHGDDGKDGDGEGTSDDSRPQLRRGHGKDKVLAGVCHGAGRYFGVDPVIFRIVLAVLALTGGIGLIIYGLGWLVIPQEDEEESEAHRLLSGRIEGAPLTAVLMALVGCGLYASMLGNGANQAFSLILLAATVAAVYWSQQRTRMQAAGETPLAAASAVADAPPAAQAPPEPGSAPSWWRDPLTKAPPYLWGPDDGPYQAADRQAWRERKRKTRKERQWPFGLVAFLLAATAAGVGTCVAVHRTSVGSSVEIGLASALGVFGVAYLIASFAGRPRGLTAFWSLLTIAGLIGAASLPKDQEGWTSRWTPTTTTAIQPSYVRGAGDGVLDLRTVSLGNRTVSTRLDVHVGEAEVKLPPNATVVLTYHIGVGDVLLPGKSHSGVNIRSGTHDTEVYSPRPGTPSTGTIDLTVKVGVGDLRVVR
ncbi:PspC domain-containing protein [Streptomyces sp. NBC_00669]|uniref:PspC domain-containing protein n=1 Tax=Streptomyces sp. NBC_00669 TaxID=2976011 RepID=UPI002E329333|nr:PspC domain-containing protein [Streptomyces sp. NBC_00669]